MSGSDFCYLNASSHKSCNQVLIDTTNGWKEQEENTRNKYIRIFAQQLLFISAHFLFTDSCVSVYVNVTTCNIETTEEIKIRERLRYTVDKEEELLPNHDQQTIFAFG